jgi:hypothetical protein
VPGRSTHAFSRDRQSDRHGCRCGGCLTLAENDVNASRCGFAFRIKAPDGDDFDVQVNQHTNFITATFDDFAQFLRAAGASGPNVPHPTQIVIGSLKGAASSRGVRAVSTTSYGAD